MAKAIPVSASANETLLGERLRIASIIESPEGILRPEVARKLALHSTMDSASAVELLRSVPVANPYLAAMNLEGPVGVDSLSGASPNNAADKKQKRIEEIRRNVKPQPRQVV